MRLERPRHAASRETSRRPSASGRLWAHRHLARSTLLSDRLRHPERFHKGSLDAVGRGIGTKAVTGDTIAGRALVLRQGFDYRDLEDLGFSQGYGAGVDGGGSEVGIARVGVGSPDGPRILAEDA